MSDVTLPARDTYTPHDIAVAVFGEARAFQGAKLVRDYLRATYPRTPDQRNTSWLLGPNAAKLCVDAMTARKVNDVVEIEVDDADADA